MEQYFEISLEGLMFYSRIGVFESEREIGNEFRVSMDVKIPADMSDDNLQDTVSYAALYEIIKKEMESETLLLETVARQIMRKAKESYPEILEGFVSIEKITPPIAGITGSARVTYRASY